MALTQGVLKQLERIISRKDNLIQHKCYKWKFEGKWLRAGDCHYMSDGKERVWEMTERTTKKGTIDGVDIIATCTSIDKEMISLVAIYRPPVDKISIEFPAGLINEGEVPSLAAIRELREETGQEGVCESISSVIYSDPWKSNESSLVTKMSITRGGQELLLDDDEFLEHFHLPVDGLINSLKAIQEKFDVVIEAKLYLFAVGLEMGRQH